MQADISKAYVSFMTKCTPGKMRGHPVNSQSTLSCVGCFGCCPRPWQNV